MLEEIGKDEYQFIMKSPRRESTLLEKYYKQCMHSLVSRWAAQLSNVEFKVMSFIFDRTFYNNRMSETIVLSQFIIGMESKHEDRMIFSGINVGEVALQKALKELATRDFIHARACKEEGKDAEFRPRIYAINCKMLFNLDLADEENPMILRVPKAKSNAVEVESDAKTTLKTPRNPRITPPSKSRDIYTLSVHTKVCNRIDKSILLAAPSAGEQNLSRAQQIQVAVKERMDAGLAKQAERKAKRASLPSADYKWKRDEVQSLFSTNMRKYFPASPLSIVSEKPLAVFRKRMAEFEINDLAAFIEWAVCYWESTTNRQRNSLVRAARQGHASSYTEISRSPDFTSLAYRLPYFVAVYRTFVTERTAGFQVVQSDKDAGEIAKLKRTIKDIRADKDHAVQQLAKMRRSTRSAPAIATDMGEVVKTVRPRASTLPPDDDELFAPLDLPSWEEIQANKKVRK